MLEFRTPTVSRLPKLDKAEGRRRVVMVAIPGAYALELMGPMEVLNEANYFLKQSDRDDLGYDIEIVTTEPGTVFEISGLKMIVDKAYYNLKGSIDTVIFQSIEGHGHCLKDERFVSWVRQISKNTRRVASVCIGAYILAEAGLLDGRRATTHWSSKDDFQRRYPNVELDTAPIYIKDDNIYTSAGACSGMDLMLALIEEDFGAELALRVAQSMVLFLKRPATQSQFSVIMNSHYPIESKITKIQSHIAENPNSDLSIEALSNLAGMSARNFTRVFKRQVGLSPGKFVETSRLEFARQWLEQSNFALSEISFRSGYNSTDAMRLAFNRNLKIGPNEYRRRFATSH